MHGTFNGVQLRTISSRKITTREDGSKLYGFRVTGKIPKATSDALEATLSVHGAALLILGDEIIEGTIAEFSKDPMWGYEVTIESNELCGPTI